MTGNFIQEWANEAHTAFANALTFSRLLPRIYDTEATDAESITVSKIGVSQPFLNIADKAQWSEGEPILAPPGTQVESTSVRIDIDQRRRVEGNVYVEDTLETAVRRWRSEYQQAAIGALAQAYETQIAVYLGATQYVTRMSGESFQDFLRRLRQANNGAGSVAREDHFGEPDQLAGVNFSGSVTGTTPDARARVVDAVRLMLTGFPPRGTVRMPGEPQGPPERAMAIVAQGVGLLLQSHPDLARALIPASAIDEPVADIPGYIGRFDQVNVFYGAGGEFVQPPPAGFTTLRADLNHVLYPSDLVAPFRPLRSYVVQPENAGGERYEFKHILEFGTQILEAFGQYRFRSSNATDPIVGGDTPGGGGGGDMANIQRGTQSVRNTSGSTASVTIPIPAEEPSLDRWIHSFVLIGGSNTLIVVDGPQWIAAPTQLFAERGNGTTNVVSRVSSGVQVTRVADGSTATLVYYYV